MSEYFKRQIQLWGENTQEILNKKSIAIIGSGGLGCSLGLSLGASGIGKIYLVDFDTVSFSNIHRQIAFNLEHEGDFKSKVLKNTLIKRVYKDIKIENFVSTFKEFAQKNIDLDLILDATDNIKTRKEINDYAKKVNTPWIYSSVEEYNGQICFFDKANFNDIFNLKEAIPKGQTPPMVMQVASFSANLALRYLANLQIQKDKLYYIFFDKKGEINMQNFKLFL